MHDCGEVKLTSASDKFRTSRRCFLLGVAPQLAGDAKSSEAAAAFADPDNG
jgi:hypothetical protein